MSCCPAQKTAQHISPSLIGRHDPVRYHKCHRTDMICDNTDGNIFFCLCPIGYPGKFTYLIPDRLDRVHIKDGIHILHHDSKTLQSHSGINIFIGQFFVVSLSIAVKLGEYVIPDLYIAVTLTTHGTSRFVAAVFLSAVKINLRGGATWSRAVLPEVIFFAKAEDTLLCHPDLFIPDIKCLIILFVYRRIQTVLWNLQYLCKELPRPGNGLMLEIVSKGKITEHLKKCTVAGSLSHILDISSTNALLAGGHPLSRRNLLSCKIGL